MALFKTLMSFTIYLTKKLIWNFSFFVCHESERGEEYELTINPVLEISSIIWNQELKSSKSLKIMINQIDR